METTFTVRDAPHAYVQLQITTQVSKRALNVHLDEITLKTYLNSALAQYLGITGTAIDINILKVDGSLAWIQLPAQDESATVAALSQWTGQTGVTIRVLGRGNWLGGLTYSAYDGKLWSLEP